MSAQLLMPGLVRVFWEFQAVRNNLLDEVPEAIGKFKRTLRLVCMMDPILIASAKLPEVCVRSSSCPL